MLDKYTELVRLHSDNFLDFVQILKNLNIIDTMSIVESNLNDNSIGTKYLLDIQAVER